MQSQGSIIKAQNAAEVDGNGTVVPLGGRSSLVVQVFGTFSATVTFEASLDGSNWIAVALANLNSTTRARATTATAAGLFLLDAIGGLELFRARVSSYASGAVSVFTRASD